MAGIAHGLIRLRVLAPPITGPSGLTVAADLAPPPLLPMLKRWVLAQAALLHLTQHQAALNRPSRGEGLGGGSLPRGSATRLGYRPGALPGREGGLEEGSLVVGCLGCGTIGSGG